MHIMSEQALILWSLKKEETADELQLSTAHCIPLVVSMRHDRKNDIQGSVGKKADGYANQLSI